jgi:hypothetical protein
MLNFIYTGNIPNVDISTQSSIGLLQVEGTTHRANWAAIERALRNGESITIRPANELEVLALTKLFSKT